VEGEVVRGREAVRRRAVRERSREEEEGEREVVRRMGRKEGVRRMERKPLHYLSLSLLTSSPSFLSVILTTALLPSSQSSSLLLSLIPIHPSHYLSPSFLSVILPITSLPPSFQSSSPPLHPSFLSIRHLITSLLGRRWRRRREIGSKEELNRRMETEERQRL
jgi:hypothetical protein